MEVALKFLAEMAEALLLPITAHPSQADDVAEGLAAMRTGDFTGASTA